MLINKTVSDPPPLLTKNQALKLVRTLSRGPAYRSFSLVNAVFVESELFRPLRSVASAEHDPWEKCKTSEQQAGKSRGMWSTPSWQRTHRKALPQVSTGNKVRRRHLSQQQAVGVSSRQSGCTPDTPEPRSRSAPGEGR